MPETESGKESMYELTVLLFTDIGGSVELQQRLGTEAYTKVVARHDALIQFAFEQSGTPPVILKETGDGVLAKFGTASDAVNAALRIQALFAREQWQIAELQVRIGIHLGQVTEMSEEITGDRRAVGMAINLAARVMDLAEPGQILTTRSVFDDARQFISAHPPIGDENFSLPELQWPAHGRYRFKGYDTPLDIFEVGAEGIAPLRVPSGSTKAERDVIADEEAILGWRPGAGLSIPRRKDWVVIRKIGVGGSGEVWLIEHKTTKEQRAFKFCFDAQRLQSFKRELTLFRLLRDALGKRNDIASLYEVSVEEPPFYLESEFVEAGNLGEWAQSEGGIKEVPMNDRLNMFANIVRAVDAAHSVGIIHKDIKPSNILIAVEAGKILPRLADFGVGQLASTDEIHRLDITQAGFTGEVDLSGDSTLAGTQLYFPPEYLVGQEPSVRGDVYALGVILYQLVAGDLSKPLGSGWQRDIEDDLLREDIERCVDMDPLRRFASAQRLAERITNLEERRIIAKAEETRQLLAVRRRRLLILTGVGMVILGVIAAFLGYAYLQQKELELQARATAREQRELKSQARATASGLDFRIAGKLLEQDRSAAAVAHLSRAIRYNPGNSAAAQKLMATLAARNFMRPERAPFSMGGAGQLITTHAMAVSPDGTKIASVYDLGHKVGIWDLRSGKSLARELEPGGGRCTRLAFDSSGEILLTSSLRALRIWNSGDGKMENERKAGKALLSMDGRYWLRQFGTPKFSLWDLENNKEIQGSIPALDRVPREFAFAPNGRQVLALSLHPVGQTFERVVSLIDLDKADHGSPQWNEIMRFKDSYTAPRLLHTSADFSLMALALEDGSVGVWRLADGKLFQTFPKPGDQVITMEFSRDGGKLVIGYLGNSALIWDMVTGTPIGVPLHHDGGVVGIWMSPNGISVVTGSLDMTTRAWDLGSGIALTEPMRHSDTPVGAKFLDGGRRLVTTSFDGQAWSWNLEGSEALSIPLDMPGARIAAVSAGGKIYAKIIDLKTLKVLSLGSRTAICPDIRHDSEIQLAQFSKDGTRLSSFSERQVKLTSLKDGATITHSLASQGGERIWTIGPKGNCVITAAKGPREKGLTGFIVTNFSTGDVQSYRFEMRDTVNAVAIHDDGERLAISTNSEGLLSERSAEGEYKHRRFDALKYAISMDFNHDGSRLLCGRIDYTARVFRVDDKGSISVPLRHSGPVVAVAFGTASHEKELVVTLSSTFEDEVGEQSLQLWDADTGESLTPTIKIEGPSANLWTQFAPVRVGMGAGGRQLSVVFKEGMASLWDAFPAIDGKVPPWISDLGEVVGGIKLGDNGRRITLPFEKYKTSREQVLERASHGELGNWATWVMARPSERSISPNSQIGVMEWIDRRTNSSNIAELRLALRLCPDHPTMRALLAEKLLMQSADSSEAEWFLNSSRLFFESPLTELPQHVSEYQYKQGKAALERIKK